MAENEQDSSTKEPYAYLLEQALKLLPAAAAALVLILSGAAGIYAPVTSAKQLTIIGSLVSTADHTEVRGRVVQDGDSVDKALVWVIVEYASGQRDSPPATQTDEKGGFSVGPVLKTLGSDTDKIVGARVFARKDKPASAWYRSGSALRGEEIVRAAGVVSQEAIELSPYKLLPLPATFLISAMLPFFGEATRWKHVFAVILAFLFTGLMIVYLSLGLKYVNTTGKADGIIALGFASVYQGTYVKDVQAEWLFSFTSPPPKPAAPVTVETKPASLSQPASQTLQAVPKERASTAPPSGDASTQPAATPTPKIQTDAVVVDHGFGAPLWVLLVSVLGAGVLTVGLIVGEITQIPNEPDEIRKHLQAIVQHQFFILFAPVGAIFVYQILVVGSAATSSFTVALAALGAGASLSALLTKAVTSAMALINGIKDPNVK
jgi:hypothetical protein